MKNSQTSARSNVARTHSRLRSITAAAAAAEKLWLSSGSKTLLPGVLPSYILSRGSGRSYLRRRFGASRARIEKIDRTLVVPACIPIPSVTLYTVRGAAIAEVAAPLGSARTSLCVCQGHISEQKLSRNVVDEVGVCGENRRTRVH